jgi:ribose transport system ATP-binding protein
LKEILQFAAVEKSFFGVKVLKAVSFALAAGNTLGLVGENGAGKSTLMNLLGGNLQPDAGQMILEGEEYAPKSPRDAERNGIAFIHQELNLFQNLSIAENIFLTRFPRRAGLIDRRKVHESANALLREVGLDLPVQTPVERLSAGERQLVEIAKALSREPRIILLDEPTSSLTAIETGHLFNLLGKLRARGISMIYISHALEDVLRICDDIVVLRDGEVVGTGPRSRFDSRKLISLMVGRSIDQLFPPREIEPSSQTLLRVRGVSQANIVHNISFALQSGEVLGISGLMGSGRTELARILFGLDPMTDGEIFLDGQPIHNLSARQRIQRGLAFLTESRRDEGLLLEAGIADNLTLVSAPRQARGPLRWLARKQLDRSVKEMRQAVKLTRTAADHQPVKTLSGGNQQKVVLGKWLLNKPRVFVLDEPTRGIDVGAKQEIYILINQLAAAGAGVLMISSEIEELIGMCDRVLVMSQGEIKDEIARAGFDRERILESSLREPPAGSVEP